MERRTRTEPSGSISVRAIERYASAGRLHMSDGMKEPRPLIMWTTSTGAEAHARVSGQHEALCGSDARISFSMPETKIPVRLTCLSCEKKVAVMVMQAENG